MKNLSIFQIAVFCLILMCNKAFADIVMFVDNPSEGAALAVLPEFVSDPPSRDFDKVAYSYIAGNRGTLANNWGVDSSGNSNNNLSVGIVPQNVAFSTLCMPFNLDLLDFDSCDGPKELLVYDLSGNSHDVPLEDTRTTWFRISKLLQKTK